MQCLASHVNCFVCPNGLEEECQVMEQARRDRGYGQGGCRYVELNLPQGAPAEGNEHACLGSQKNASQVEKLFHGAGSGQLCQTLLGGCGLGLGVDHWLLGRGS